MGPTAILGDNSASYQLIQKAGSSQLTRYFEQATILVKYAIMGLIVRPFLISTKHMRADIFTKAVDEETFFFCKHTLHNIEPETYVMFGCGTVSQCPLCVFPPCRSCNP